MRRNLLTMGALLLTLVGVSSTQAGSPAPAKTKPEPSEVKKVNALVATIDKALLAGEHPTLEIHENESIPTEGVPPRFKLYYEPEQQRLVAAVISVGHETWGTEFRYYFYPDGKLMKYTKTINGRPDNPPKQAMILDKNGAVLWKNTDEPHVPAEELVRLFGGLEKLSERFAAY
jgi:hypothetical protein